MTYLLIILSVFLYACTPAPNALQGSFELVQHTIDVAIEEADGQSVADITGDGVKNIVIGTGDGGKVYWYERNASGTWVRHLVAEGFIEIEGTVSADFNGDGHIEIIILDQATRDPSRPNVYIAKQDTDAPRASWSVRILDEHAPHVQQGLATDITGNGLPDLVYAYEGVQPGEGGFFWLENLAGDPLDSQNWIKHEIDQIDGAWWIDYNSPRDFNGNGRSGDLLTGVRAGGRSPETATGGVFIYIQPEDPRQPWQRIGIETSFPTLQVSSGDLTGNGDPRDIVAGASHDSPHSGLYLYDASNGWARTTIDPGNNWWGTYAYDINRDGRAEIVTGERSQNTLRIYAYDAESGQFTVRASAPFLKPDDQIIFSDITGDGYKTEFYVGSDPDGLFWFEAFSRH